MEVLRANFCTPGCIFTPHVLNVLNRMYDNPTRPNITIALQPWPTAIHVSKFHAMFWYMFSFGCDSDRSMYSSGAG